MERDEVISRVEDILHSKNPEVVQNAEHLQYFLLISAKQYHTTGGGVSQKYLMAHKKSMNKFNIGLRFQVPLTTCYT